MARTIFMQVKEALLNFISQQKLAGNKLPSEEELAERLDVSRGTIREVLRALDRAGIISKKHGFGNFVHASALQAKMRIDQIEEFYALIEDGGYKASITIEEQAARLILPDDTIRKQLQLEENELTVFFDCLYHANDNPAIYCEIFLPRRIFFEQPAGKPVVRSIFEFLRTNCKQEVEHTLIWFVPVLADAKLAELLKLPPQSPLIVWEELYYNFFDEVICSSKSYFSPQIMKFCMLRKLDGFAAGKENGDAG